MLHRIWKRIGNIISAFLLKVVLNHETYILDLGEANKGNVQWTFEYSAKVIYKQCVIFWLCMYTCIVGVDTEDLLVACTYLLITKFEVCNVSYKGKNGDVWHTLQTEKTRLVRYRYWVSDKFGNDFYSCRKVSNFWCLSKARQVNLKSLLSH